MNLSNKNLGDKEIKDGKEALSELVALDTLDLSGNRLTKFPDLTFSDCRVLNITHNNLEPFPDDAKMSWTLEEIDIRGNPALNINERYKLRELVPKLKILDGEDVPENDVFFTIKKNAHERTRQARYRQIQGRIDRKIGTREVFEKSKKSSSWAKKVQSLLGKNFSHF